MAAGGAFITVWAMANAGGINGLSSWFAVWALAPHGILMIAGSLARTPMERASAVVIAALSIVSSFIYFDSSILKDPQGGLIFVFVPFYQLVVVSIAVAIAVFARVLRDIPKHWR
jgi:hypothetical protein